MKATFTNKEQLFGHISRLGYQQIEGDPSFREKSDNNPIFTERGFVGTYSVLPDGKIVASINSQLILPDDNQ